MVILLGTNSISLYRSALTISDTLVYSILIIVFAYHMLSNNRRRRINMLRWNERMTEEYINSLQTVSDELRGIRHDWNNILQVYDGYLATDDLEGLRKFNKSVLTANVKTNRNVYLISALSQRKAVYTVLQIKLQKAEQQHIRIDIGRLDELTQVSMSDLDLCRILGNLMDNAVEEAAVTEEKRICLSCCENGAKSVRLVISNSTAKEVDLQHIYDKGFTTKKDHSGWGLNTVQSILASYDHCYMLADCRDNTFFAYLILKTA